MNVYGYCIITASEPYALRTSKTLFFPFSFLTLPFGLAHHRYFIHSACIRSDIIDSWENFGSRTSYSQFQWLVTHSVSVSHMHTRFQFILIFTSIIGHGKTPPTYSMLVTCVLQQHQRWWWRRPTTDDSGNKSNDHRCYFTRQIQSKVSFVRPQISCVNWRCLA